MSIQINLILIILAVVGSDVFKGWSGDASP